MIVCKLRRFVLWLRQPFGSRCVQSPGVYTFISDVISNCSPFYAYKDLRSQLHAMSRSDRKVARLLMRLSNYMQAEKVLLTQDNRRFASFVEIGCSKTKVEVARDQVSPLAHLSDPSLPENYIFFFPKGQSSSGLGKEPSAIDSQQSTKIKGLAEQVVVIPYIYKTPAAYRSWQKLTAATWASVVFDLGIAGVILINPAYGKQQYVIKLKS
ncbi:MAG: hypothetical protein IKO67_06100 [Bacteroidaceae bacterium]|nr:hypothetical protein [Bacteroidaceae bacterium]